MWLQQAGGKSPGVSVFRAECHNSFKAALAQMEEQPLCTVQVAGSIHASGSKFHLGVLSAWSDGLPWKQEAGGSNPPTQTKNLPL